MALDNKTILITGGLGQIGVTLIQHLQATYATATIHVLDLKTPDPGSLRDTQKVTYHAGNVTDQAVVSEIFDAVKPEIVFHTAGLIPQIALKLGMDNEESYMKVNLEGTKIVLEESRRVGVKAFVYTSSADVVKGKSWDNLNGVNEDYPIPTVFDGLYAKSKAKAETQVLTASDSSFPTTALRTHAAFSAYDANIIPLFLAAPRNIRLGSGTNLYDFTYAPNLALAHELAAVNLLTSKTAAGKAFFVTNAEPVEFKTFLGWIYDADDGVEDGKKVKATTIPIGVAKPLLWLWGKVGKVTGTRPLLTLQDLGDSVSQRWFDNGRARELLNYVPTIGLREGVKLAVEGYKAAKEREGKKEGIP